jgi:hypothetical protein
MVMRYDDMLKQLARKESEIKDFISRDTLTLEQVAILDLDRRLKILEAAVTHLWNAREE